MKTNTKPFVIKKFISLSLHEQVHIEQVLTENNHFKKQTAKSLLMMKSCEKKSGSKEKHVITCNF